MNNTLVGSYQRARDNGRKLTTLLEISGNIIDKLVGEGSKESYLVKEETGASAEWERGLITLIEEESADHTSHLEALESRLLIIEQMLFGQEVEVPKSANKYPTSGTVNKEMEAELREMHYADQTRMR